MADRLRPQLGRVVTVPLGIIGVLAALLVWQVEHAGSLATALLLAAASTAVGIVVVHRVRRDLDRLSHHYETLLETADRASRQAESANRLKDEFLATISHELRTPLNSVLGWAHLLNSGRLTADQTTKAIQAIERAGWTQSRLIEDLLDLSQIVGGNLRIAPRAVVVQPLIESAAQGLQNTASAKHIRISTDLDPTLGPIAVDPDRLRQIAWHLISNAVKFTPAGGHVDVSLSVEGDRVVLSVCDTGIGFAPAVAEHLFERFSQGDSSPTRQYGGLGVGLGIVRHLVELHGGTVDAKSAGLNLGSMFEVRLPLRTVDDAGAEVMPPPAPPFLRGVSVLLVDDDAGELQFARSALEQYGAFVATASSAAEAFDRFRAGAPDVLVSDLRLPDADGLDLVRRIRGLDAAHGGDTPAAALTGLARTDDRRNTLAVGFQMHLTKPIDALELASSVARLAGADEDERADGTTDP